MPCATEIIVDETESISRSVLSKKCLPLGTPRGWQYILEAAIAYQYHITTYWGSLWCRLGWLCVVVGGGSKYYRGGQNTIIVY